jgi:hypothetical protein
LAKITGPALYKGSLSGSGNSYVLNYKAQNNVISALYWLRAENKKSRAIVLDTALVVAGLKDTLNAGSVVLQGITTQQASQLNDKFGLDLEATSEKISGKQHEVILPKIGLYHTWFDTQDEGWARYTFEQRAIPYTSIDKDDLRAGDLKGKYDVIVVPSASGSASDFIHEIEKKFGPMPYTKTAQFPAHGVPDGTNDLTGGPGFEGIGELKKFVEAGGLLVTLDQSTVMAAETGIIRELERYNAGALFHPGSVVTAKARKPKHPVFYGYPDSFHIFRGNGPLFQVAKYDRDMILLQYGSKPQKDEIEYKGIILGMPGRKPRPEEKKSAKKEEPYVISGMVRNEDMIVGQGAIFNVPAGKGRVVAFTFNPLHRYLNHHDAPLLWNVLMNWKNF